ncbi:hypothetical protein [Neorhizobium tomejilense]|uniref:hypothetical protein n=1 Tax=Neorhizobium tomejilense TaxID=2093828 RepID=UPI003ECFE1E1
MLPTIIKEARAAGAITALITDLSAAASAKATNHVLRCRCRSPSPFNSLVAAVTIINYLAWSVSTAMGEASLARFEKIDRLVKLLDDVSPPRPVSAGGPAKAGFGQENFSSTCRRVGDAQTPDLDVVSPHLTSVSARPTAVETPSSSPF